MPHFIISRMIVLKLIKFIKADSAFYTLFRAIFTFLPTLIKNIGIVPVAYGIFNVYTFLNKGLKLNPLLVKTILEAITPVPEAEIFVLKNLQYLKIYLNYF